jgi:hypothetical protein
MRRRLEPNGTVDRSGRQRRDGCGQQPTLASNFAADASRLDSSRQRIQERAAPFGASCLLLAGGLTVPARQRAGLSCPLQDFAVLIHREGGSA